jgi:hypothetical protein
MAVKHYTYNLTATPIALTDVVASDKRRGVTIIFNTDKNSNDTTMIGGSTVTATDFGIHLDADRQFVIEGEYNSSDVFYARAKTTTAILHVLLVGA